MTDNGIILDQVKSAVSVSSEEPTPRLRWKKGILQQYWVTWSRVEGATRYLYEWRDVPTDNTDG